MNNLIKDIRYAVRGLLKQKSFTAIAVVTLALGIGVNTAIFSVVNAFLLRPLPYGDPNALVMVDSQNGGKSVGVSFLDYEDWRTQNRVFEDIAFFNLRWNANLDFGTETETLKLTFGTPNLFSTLKVAPMLGHGPDPRESGDVLISHALWQRRFASDPNILGRKLRIDGSSLTVIGVMPPGFRFPFQTDIWWLQDRNFNRENRAMRIDQSIARLKPGVTVDQANAEIKQLAARLAQTFPDTNREVTASVTPLRDSWVGDLRTSLWLLLGACTFVLLIACANVANLLLTRASGRAQEFAVRSALGASRWRLIRQSFAEVMLLTFLGCAGGLVLGEWSLRALVMLLPSELLPFFIKFNLDSRVLAFSLLISVLTGILCGVAPAFRSSSVNLNDALKKGGQKSGARSHRFGSALVVTEIALAIVLLVGAGLMVRSLVRLQNTSTGFEAENLLHLEINPTYPTQQDYNVRFMSSLYQRLIEATAKVPGVVAVAANSDSPFVGQRPWYRGRVALPGQAASELEQNPLVNYQAVSPDYFKVMQIPVLQGRVFTDRDTVRPEDQRDVAVINHRLATRLWPGGDAIGKRINCDDDNTHCAEIVGIVGDVKHNSVDDDFGYDFYYACYQSYAKQTHFLARTSGDPMMFAPAIKKAIWEVSPDTGIFNVTPVATLSDNTIWQRRLSGVLLGAFSALSLLLAAAGVYGVMTYFVAQRTREIGIRLALGAQRGDVLRLVVRNGMTLALIGLAIGVAGALALTRLLRAMLFEVTPTDPITFAVVALGLVGVALLACYVPARRATKVDPLVALRYE